tara:strand:- start:369 stop:605 length:237 start_codon:yes stop_codon:yes gene_type:complete
LGEKAQKERKAAGLIVILAGRIRRQVAKLVSLVGDKKVKKEQSTRLVGRLLVHAVRKVEVKAGVKNQLKEKNNVANKK